MDFACILKDGKGNGTSLGWLVVGWVMATSVTFQCL
jgi:hypothetical protein